MDNFLKASGAVVIGLGIAAGATFPWILGGIILGWFYIQESLQPDEDD